MEAPIFHILSVYHQILRRASLARLCPVVYLSSAFYTEQTNACLFCESYIYSPSCLPQTQKVVVSSQLHWLLVCFVQLYNETHISKPEISRHFHVRAPLMWNQDLTQRFRKVNWCVECCPCDLFTEGNITGHLHHHNIEWYINYTDKQNIKMDNRLYFKSSIKFSVVSSSSYSEDGNVSEMDV